MHASHRHSCRDVHRHVRSESAPDPRLDRALRQLTLAMCAAVLVVPPLHRYHAAVGWLPLWLAGMPALTWWALHRFPLPALRRAAPASLSRRPRRGRAQALRRADAGRRLPATARTGAARAA